MISEKKQDDNQSDNEEELQKEGGIKVKKSKGQLKKEKEKAKKEAAKVIQNEEQKKEDEEKEGEENEQQQQQQGGVKKEGKKGKATKGKKPNMVAQLAMQRVQLMKEEEERIKREEEELKRKEEEELRRIEEEIQKKKEAEELRKKQKEAKIISLIQSGQYLTKEQIRKQKIEQQRIAMLQQQGLFQQVEKTGDNNNNINENQEQVQKKSQVVRAKTRKPKKVENYQIQEESQEVQKEEQKDAVDDWEQMIEKEIQKDKKEQKMRKDSKLSERSGENCNQVINSTSNKQNLNKKKHNIKDDSDDDLLEGQIRSPICCILGHVDTGKTTLLDKIRNTNVQEGEAGGITQQIGATYFPRNKLEQEVLKCNEFFATEVNMPGLLIIDTPGHESFSNLRSRGSGLCDFAILVVDLMHGLEQQTLESIELLTMRNTPFLVAVNKIDRIFKWQVDQDQSSYLQLQKQGFNQKAEFDQRLNQLIIQLTEKGFNVELYWKNDNVREYISLVPTSGVTGEGIPDLLSCVVKYTQQFLKNKITIKSSFNCTILEVTKIEGLGTTIDVILVNGVLREGDTICLLGFEGPIVTTIRALLTPHPMKEMRVKNEYQHHKKIKAAMGIKICANNLDQAVAGSALYRVDKKEDIKYYSNECMRELENVRKKIELQQQGVCVAASTLGSLEALLQFLKSSKIPVAYICVGTVSKEDVLKAMKNLLNENPQKRLKEYATVLAFDVKILPDAQAYSDQNGIKIITGNIIYHLFDKFTQYITELREEKKKAVQNQVVFPVIIKPVTFFNKKDPLIMGVDVEDGILKIGTPICLYNSTKLKVGVVESIELNKKSLKEARKETGSVAIRVKTDGNLTAGRQLVLEDKFVSILTRNSIDILKDHFRKDLTKSDWDLVRTLKTFFEII